MVWQKTASGKEEGERGKRGRREGGSKCKLRREIQIMYMTSEMIQEKREALVPVYGILITSPTLLSPSLSQPLFFWYLSWSIWTVSFAIELAVPR